jgi:SAM-dependent methyltransferase
MILSEKILLAFCKKNLPETRQAASKKVNIEDALALLKRIYPHFIEGIKNKSVCDFGCGEGHQSLSLAYHGAKEVVGIDLNPKHFPTAYAMCKEFEGGQYASRVRFSQGITDQDKGAFDVVISQNSMEHFPDPVKTLHEMKSLLKPSGKLLVTFGPPWFAPYGAHMQFFTSLPWVHLIFSERTIMNVRKRYRSDGANRFEDVESGLNKMSVAKFKRIIRESGMQIDFVSYECVKGMNLLGKIPFFSELFINHLSAVLAISPKVK